MHVRSRERRLRTEELANDVITEIVKHKDKDDENDVNEEEANNDDHIMTSLARHQEAILSNGVDD